MLDQSIQLWRDAFDFLPPHDMAAGVYRAIGLDPVDDVVAEVDGVAVVDVFTARCAYPENECQPELCMRDREARAQRGLDLVAYHAEHRRYASDVTGVWIPSEKALDLFCLFSAPYLLSNARRLFTALPFLFLVLSNPRFERIELVAFRDCSSD